MSGPDSSFCICGVFCTLECFGERMQGKGISLCIMESVQWCWWCWSAAMGVRQKSIQTVETQEWFTHKRVRFECAFIASWVRKLEASQKYNSRLHSGGGGWWAGMGVWQKSIHIPCCQGGAVLTLVCFRSPHWVYPLNLALILRTASWKLVLWIHSEICRSIVRLRRYSQVWSITDQGVSIIPAFCEGGFWNSIVRSLVGRCSLRDGTI